jgi:hypothetical protein
MAAATIPAPGTTLGPCPHNVCGHIDCRTLRAMADSVCRLCDRPISYVTRYYLDPEDRHSYVHAVCLETGRAEVRS